MSLQVRFYWSMRVYNKRCRYVCSIHEANGRPEFRVLVQVGYNVHRDVYNCMHQFYILVGQKVQFKDNLTAIAKLWKIIYQINLYSFNLLYM